MKISSETLAVLQNFAVINNGILVAEGDTLKTISTNKTVLASAKIAETFDSPFCIYALPEFLAVVSTFSQPEFEFGEKEVTISEGSSKLVYVYADPATIVLPPNKELSTADHDVAFTITEADLSKLAKVGSIMNLEELVITNGGDGKLSIAAADVKNPSSNMFETLFTATKIPENDFKAILKFDNLKLLPDAYAVEVSSKGLARLSGKTAEYFVAVEASSKFN